MFKKRIIAKVLSIIDARIERYQSIQIVGDGSFSRVQSKITTLRDLRDEITEVLNFKSKIKHETNR
jgi:hypothetical protein